MAETQKVAHTLLRVADDWRYQRMSSYVIGKAVVTEDEDWGFQQ